MKSKDQKLIAEAYNKVLNEQGGYEGNIADQLHNLLSSLNQETGSPHRQALYKIIMELGDAVDSALDQADTDPAKALQDLLSKLRLD